MATTTNYSWTTPDNTAYVKDGASAIRSLGSSVDSTLFTALGGAYPGLRLIKRQTVGTAVASVTVTSAFSATYDNYKIVFTGIDASVADELLTLQLNNSTGSTYNYATRWVNYATAAFGGVVSGTPKTSIVLGLSSTTDNCNYGIDVINPFAARRTGFNVQGSSDTNMVWGGGQDTNAASSANITLSIASGTMTGGTIAVYGYGIS